MLSTVAEQKLLSTRLDLHEIDMHLHTKFSDGNCSIDTVLSCAQARGLKAVAITDHYSDKQTLPGRMKSSDVEAYLKMLKPFNVIKGVEVDLFPQGPSISKQTTDTFDVVAGGLHQVDDVVFGCYYPKKIDVKSFVETVRLTMIKAVESDLIDVLVHPLWFPETIRSQAKQLITKDWIDSLLDSVTDHQVALEINGSWRVPNRHVVKECLKRGIKVSIGSDSHDKYTVGNTAYPLRLLKELGATVEDVFCPDSYFSHIIEKQHKNRYAIPFTV
jgi:putative hydrolase